VARLSPQEMAAKWRDRASAATGDYQAGVERVSGSPGQAAARKADKWFAGIQNSRSKWQERVAGVSEAEWKQATVEKGAPRFATGVQAAEGKMAQFASEFFPHLDAVTNRVKAMPDTTLEQRLARMTEQARGVSQFRRRSGYTGRSA
jgi:hypothetical protein